MLTWIGGLGMETTYQRLIDFQDSVASFQDVAIPFLLVQYGLRCREPWIATSRTRSRHLKGYCDRQESNEWDPSCLQIYARQCVTTICQIRIATFRSYVPEITRPTDLQSHGPSGREMIPPSLNDSLSMASRAVPEQGAGLSTAFQYWRQKAEQNDILLIYHRYITGKLSRHSSARGQFCRLPSGQRTPAGSCELPIPCGCNPSTIRRG